MGKIWFCRVMGETLGPMDEGALAEMVRSRSLALEDVVRRGHDGEWMPAHFHDWLTAANEQADEPGHLPPPPPPLPAPVKPKVWRYLVSEQRTKGAFSGGTMRAADLEQLINKHAQRGWELHQIIAGETWGFLSDKDVFLLIFKRLE